ncbi:MAG: flagellar biosynthetic protein FliR [Acidobacteriota bacterium]
MTPGSHGGMHVASIDDLAAPVLLAAGLRHGLGDTLVLFAAALARCLPVVVLVPFLGSRGMPAMVKMAVGVMLALPLVPWLSATVPAPLAVDALTWWLLVIRETVLGLVLALAGGMVFWGAEMAGRWIDLVRGQTMANLLVPQVQVQSSQLGAFYYQLLLVLYLLAGGHRVFLEAVFGSYELLPPFGTGLSVGLSVGLSAGLETIAHDFIAITSGLFVFAVRLVAPGVLVVIFLDLVLGVANRMAPQLDVFFLGLSLKSTAALTALALSVYTLEPIVLEAFREQSMWLLHLFTDAGS